MINCIVYNDIAEVAVHGIDGVDFEQELRRFKKMIDLKDRSYVKHKHVWRVTNLKKYTRLPFIQRGLEEARLQMSLFGSDVGLEKQ